MATPRRNRTRGNAPVAYLGLSKVEWLLVAVAFGVRLAYAITLSNGSPFFWVPLLDAKWHHLWALNVASGEMSGGTAFFRAPLYPYFLGLVYVVFGSDPWAPLVIQSLIGGFSCVVLVRIVRRIWSPVIARWSGYGMAFCPTLVYFCGELLIVTLLVFLLLLAIWSWLRVLEHPDWWGWIRTGLLFGLAGIARPTALVSLAFMAVWYLWVHRREFSLSVRRVGMVIVGCVIVILPVTVHNWAVSGDLVLISSQGGVNFYIGNNPQSDGYTASAPGEQVRRTGGYQDNVWYASVVNAEAAMGRELKPSEVSGYWLGQGLLSWLETPDKMALLTLKKAALLLGAYEIESNLGVSYRIRHSPVLCWMPVRWGLILPFAILGFLISKGVRGREWLVAALVGQALVLVGFFVTARFRQPMVPLLIPFSFVGIGYLWDNRRRVGKLVPGLLFVVVLGMAVHVEPWGLHAKEEQRIHSALGMAWGQLGQARKALAEYDLAVAADSTNLEVRFNRGQLRLQRGEIRQALEEFRALTEANPDYAPGWAGLGAVHRKCLENDQAVGAWERALELDPFYLDALLNMGSDAQERDDLERALGYFRRAVEVAPESDVARLKLGVALASSGSVREAIAEFQTILRRDPGNLAARKNLEICNRMLLSERE